MKPSKRKIWYFVYRSAVTGQWVSEAYATCHPKTTIRMRRWK
jgi:hypothetical protein